MLKSMKIMLLTLALLLPAMSWAQGKIAVVNLEQAILQTDYAQKRLAAIRAQDDYKADKAEYDKLKAEFDKLLKDVQKDAAVMSQEQQRSARQKLANKQSDLEHVTGKLQNIEQSAGQALLQELSSPVQEVLRDLIEAEKIGLLLQRQSVIHADASYSITSKVTDKLNQVIAKNKKK
ncbi:MAG: OmpH family outer membrane protein [Parahaliea sp.]